MAMLRRLSEPICAVPASEHASPIFASRATDWPDHAIRNASEAKVKFLQCQRLYREAQAQKEAQQIEQRSAEKAMRHMQFAQETEMQEKLSTELMKQQGEQLQNNFRVEQAIASNPELRLLRQRCLNEQVSANRAVQLLMDEVALEETRHREIEALKAFSVSKQKAMDLAMRRDAIQREDGKQLLNTLRSQAAAKNARLHAQQHEERRADRARADRAMERACDEDLQRLAHQRRVQAELHVCLDQQVEERKQQRENQLCADREHAQIAERYKREKQAYADQLAHERHCAEVSRQRVLTQMKSDLQTLNQERRNLDELRYTIECEELKTKRQQADELKLRKDLERRVALVREYRESIDALKKRREAKLEEEKQERQIMLEQFANNSRVDLLDDQKRRMKLLSHSREVERILLERREKKELERCRELDALQVKKEEEERAVKIIQEERQRLLEEYGLCVRLEACKHVDIPSENKH